jgi:hypothetical protein
VPRLTLYGIRRNAYLPTESLLFALERHCVRVICVLECTHAPLLRIAPSSRSPAHVQELSPLPTLPVELAGSPLLPGAFVSFTNLKPARLPSAGRVSLPIYRVREHLSHARPAHTRTHTHTQTFGLQRKANINPRIRLVAAKDWQTGRCFTVPARDVVQCSLLTLTRYQVRLHYQPSART